MIDIQTLRDRITAHLEKTGESENAFAKRLNIQQASLYRFLHNQQESLAFLSVAVILTDMGYSLLSPEEKSKLPSNDGQILQSIDGRFLRSTADEEGLAEKGLTILGVYAVAGAGQAWEAGQSDPIFNIAVPARYFKPQIVPLFIQGTSMEPTILDSAVVGVNREKTTIVPGKIYAVRLPYEGVVVKRVYVDHERKCFVLRSDNKKDETEFPDIHLPFDEGDAFIYGQVSWVLQSYDK